MMSLTMLQIRAEQVRTLEASVMDRLIASAVDHIRNSLPESYDQLGHREVRESVLLAKARSNDYGLETWSGVLAYLNVMYILGFDFDQDPRYPWAKENLTSQLLSEQEKIDRLLQMALAECEAAHATINLA